MTSRVNGSSSTPSFTATPPPEKKEKGSKVYSVVVDFMKGLTAGGLTGYAVVVPVYGKNRAQQSKPWDPNPRVWVRGSNAVAVAVGLPIGFQKPVKDALDYRFSDGGTRPLTDMEEMGTSVASGVAVAPLAHGFEGIKVVQDSKPVQTTQAGQASKGDSLKQAIVKTWNQYGVRGFTAGLHATVIRDGASTATLFKLVPWVKEKMQDQGFNEVVARSTAAVLGGGACAVVTNGVDGFKTRAQGNPGKTFSLLKELPHLEFHTKGLKWRGVVLIGASFAYPLAMEKTSLLVRYIEKKLAERTA